MCDWNRGYHVETVFPDYKTDLNEQFPHYTFQLCYGLSHLTTLYGLHPGRFTDMQKSHFLVYFLFIAL